MRRIAANKPGTSDKMNVDSISSDEGVGDDIDSDDTDSDDRQEAEEFLGSRKHGQLEQQQHQHQQDFVALT
jgi:hypothetical protein